MKNILCIGGSGHLGTKVINQISKYNVTNIDFKLHDSAKRNILLNKQKTTAQNHKNVLQNIKSFNQKFDAIIVTAGGWTGGNIKDDNYLQKINQMNQVNLYPSIFAAHIATKYLQNNGLVVFTGAAAVYKQPQPEMIAYSLAKTGVHYVATNLAQNIQSGNVVTILPEVIDSPDNRVAMPNANFSSWSKPQKIAQLLHGWVQGLNVPKNGSFILLKTKNQCLQPQIL